MIWAHVLFWGAVGILIEVVFTGCVSVISGNKNATGHTYLYMIPIYGFTGLLFEYLEKWDGYLSGIDAWIPVVVFTFLIFEIEFFTGAILRKLLGECPWLYPDSPWCVDGLIRLDFAPFWIVLSYLFHTYYPVIVLNFHLGQL